MPPSAGEADFQTPLHRTDTPDGDLFETDPLNLPQVQHRAKRAADLVKLLNELDKLHYRFVVPTPATHARFLKHPAPASRAGLRRLFGWNAPFDADAITSDELRLIHLAGVAASDGATRRSAVRVASIKDQLFVHSAYPTEDKDAVFFGPDTYRFVRFVESGLAERFSECRQSAKAEQAPFNILDIGCGSGAGGIMAAKYLTAAGRVPALLLNDLNPLALHYAKINADMADMAAEFIEGDFHDALDRKYDLIISNPPYMLDAEERTYRHGGPSLGLAMSLQIVNAAIECLAPGGRLMLYTGVAIVDGVDRLESELKTLLNKHGLSWTYAEIDPDVFGEELLLSAYENVERIAVVGLIVTAPQAQENAARR